jgi:hypothetical protein
MKAVYALYADGESAQRAVNGLRAAGVADSGITVISGEPMEDFEFSQMNRDTWIWYIASGGGLAGFAAATWLTTTTERSWPITTGNMPIVSWWPNLIIMFEMTMLGAILATVITLLVGGGLLRRRPLLYDPAVTDGKILVGVEHATETAMPELERALKVHPDVLLKTIGSP